MAAVRECVDARLVAERVVTARVSTVKGDPGTISGVNLMQKHMYDMHTHAHIYMHK